MWEGLCSCPPKCKNFSYICRSKVVSDANRLPANSSGRVPIMVIKTVGRRCGNALLQSGEAGENGASKFLRDCKSFSSRVHCLRTSRTGTV